MHQHTNRGWNRQGTNLPQIPRPQGVSDFQPLDQQGRTVMMLKSVQPVTLCCGHPRKLLLLQNILSGGVFEVWRCCKKPNLEGYIYQLVGQKSVISLQRNAKALQLVLESQYGRLHLPRASAPAHKLTYGMLACKHKLKLHTERQQNIAEGLLQEWSAN